MSWLSRTLNAFRSDRLHRDLDDEIQSHIEARMEALVAGGTDAREARRLAEGQFGNQLLLRESSRDAKLLSWLDSISKDVRFGARMLRKDWLVSTSVVLSLGLAIGACTAAFSLIDALLLRPLPVQEPNRLVQLAYSHESRRDEAVTYSYPLFQRFQAAASSQVDLFALRFDGPLRAAIFSDAGGEEEKIRTRLISENGFEVLGVKPALGRLFAPSDEHQFFAVLGHAFWKRRFHGNPAVLGQWLTVPSARGAQQFQIIGVAEERFTGVEPGYLIDAWMPITAASDARALAQPDASWLRVWGRVKPGVEPQQAQHPLQAAFTAFRREQAPRIANFATAPLYVRSAENGSPSLFGAQFERPLWIVAIIAGLVLVIACSNVASLLLARAAARRAEMAMRISIGAGRARLIQQLLIESGLLAAAACMVGFLLASNGAGPIVSLLGPSDFPAFLDLRPDWRMATFLAALGVFTTLLFGGAPALRASTVAPADVLRRGASKQSAKIGALRPLLAVQVGFSFIVLFIGGLLLVTFQKLIKVDKGFSSDGVLLITLEGKPDTPAKDRVAAAQLLDRVRQMPGVRAAGLSGTGLMGGDFAWVMTPFIRIPGRAQETVRPYYLEVSSGFFETMAIRLLDGRDFAPRDMASTASVIVNEAFARRFFPGENLLGRQFERTGDSAPTSHEIVGVVADAKYNNLREPAMPTIYAPQRTAVGATLNVKAAADPITLASALRQDIQHADPSLRVTSVTLQSTRVSNTLLRERLLALLAGFFSIVAILLVALGLYGIISYSVVQRTKEIGIRLALGADKATVARSIVSGVALMAALGLAVGIAGGLALARFVGTLLFAVKPTELMALVAPAGLLLAACMSAALIPVLRATRVNPVIALRHE